MLESYKELISAKSEIKMLKKQLAELKQIIRCKDCRFYDPKYYPGCGACLKDTDDEDLMFVCSKNADRYH